MNALGWVSAGSSSVTAHQSGPRDVLNQERQGALAPQQGVDRG